MKKAITLGEYSYLEKCLGKTVFKKGRKGTVVAVDADYGILTIQFENSVMKVKFPDAFGNRGLQLEDVDAEIEGIISRNSFPPVAVPKQTYEDLIETYTTRFNYKKPSGSFSNKTVVEKDRPEIKTVSPSQCNTCKLLKNGECGGLGGECDDYEPLVVSTTHDPSLYVKKRGNTKYIKSGQSEYDDIGVESIYKDFK